jgi:hypothetical protein
MLKLKTDQGLWMLYVELGLYSKKKAVILATAGYEPFNLLINYEKYT